MADIAASEAKSKSETKEEQAVSTESTSKENGNTTDEGKNGDSTANTTAQDKNAKSETENDKREKTSESRNGASSNRYDRDSRSRGAYKGKSSRGGKYGNKFDPSSAKETDDPVEIRKQVEFYFSDSNLPNDKFLFETIGGSENKAVPIKTIHNFKRMRRFQPFSAVVAALKDSTVLNVVDDDTAIQRKTPLPEGTGSTQPEIQKVFEDQAMSRSVYVKGFGEEGPSSQFDIEAWFSEFGATNQVRLRRTTDSSFKGSVFVEFDSEETAKKFLELDPAPKYNGRNMLIKSKKQYCDEKVDELNSGTKRVEEPDADDWKARRELDRKRGFPSNKDSRGGRGRGRGGRGGGRGRDSDRRRDNRSNDTRGRRGEDSDKEDENTTATDEAPKVQQAEESSGDKKRSREEEHDDEAPTTKKAAVESDMTGEPQAAPIGQASAKS